MFEILKCTNVDLQTAFKAFKILTLAILSFHKYDKILLVTYTYTNFVIWQNMCYVL